MPRNPGDTNTSDMEKMKMIELHDMGVSIEGIAEFTKRDPQTVTKHLKHFLRPDRLSTDK